MRELPLWLILLILRLGGRGGRFHTAERFEASVREDRATQDGTPPEQVRRAVDVAQETWGGVRGWRLSPKAAPADAPVRLVHLHGGAHTNQIGAQHWRFLADQVQATGCTVHAPLFPLAPEAGHREVKAAVDRYWQALRAGAQAQRWVLSGDSSGGGLALLMAQQWKAAGCAQPDALVLVAPWVDLSMAYARPYAGQVRDPWLELPGVECAARWWADGEPADSPQVSALFGPLEGLPPALLFYGTRDLLAAECRELALRARKAGWPMEVEEAPGMIHIYPLLPLRGGRAARARIAAALTP